MSTFNTAAGWALAGGIVALGSSIVMSEVFHSERPEEMGYVVEGVVEEGGEEEEMSIAAALNDPAASAEAGEQVFGRCASCHTVNQGGADGIGPNLYGIIGAPIAGVSGFSYSGALSGMGGTWTFDNMNQWIARPRQFADGTTMSFAGLSDPIQRASLFLYLNEQGSNVPIPPPPAEEETEAEDAEIEGEEAADPEAEAAAEAETDEAADEGGETAAE